MSDPTSRRWPAYAAAAWSLAYGALGLWWAVGGSGFPYGEADEDVGVSVLTGGAAPGDEGWGTLTPTLVFLPWKIALGLAT